MNKKILAILMALLMVLVNVAAFAEEGGDDITAPAANSSTITKQYNAPEGVTVVPGEELTFTATFDKFEAAATGATSSKHPTYSGNITAVVGANTVTITGSGEFDAAGKYYYTLSETEGSVQGVTYGAETISVILTVGYEKGVLALLDVGVAKDKDGNKNGTITNTYAVGGVNISKTVTGNAANLNDTFKATVTVAAAGENKLPSQFTVNYTDINNPDGTAVSLTSANPTFEVTLKQDTNVVITNLPLGATVTVAENDEKVNAANAETKDAAKYDASYANNGAAAAATAPTIAVTNTRTTSIDTGVNTDSLPYFMLLAFVMILAAAVVLKKRTVNE
ncbi:MAG: hypothetical protein IJN79_05480 [Clostridia bacterium]|nr:hypothetical protein [Clostridia bacterium]